MSYRLVQEDILSVSADAAVLGVEMTMRPADGPVCEQLAGAGARSCAGPSGR